MHPHICYLLIFLLQNTHPMKYFAVVALNKNVAVQIILSIGQQMRYKYIKEWNEIWCVGRF